MNNDTPKISENRQKKEKIVAELVEKIDSSNGLVFADYQGLTHKQLEGLKKELKTLDSTIVVTKNSLVKISLGKSKNFADYKDNEGLNLPTATILLRGDIVGPLKKLQKAIKDFGLPKIKFGILEGQLLNETQVIKIASLPNRETLLTQLVGTLNSPIQGLVVTLNGTIQKFVMTLGAIAKSRPSSPAVEDNGGQAKPAEESTQATPEPAVTAVEPATQTDVPVETDEALVEPIEPVTSEATPIADQTENEEKSDESKGGEN